MKTLYKDTDEATNKWWAFQDARMKNIKNKSHYSAAIHRKVEAMMAVLSTAYQGRVYEAYNPRRVSVKVDKPMVRDREMLRAAEAAWAQEGITKTQTSTGFLYRLI